MGNIHLGTVKKFWLVCNKTKLDIKTLMELILIYLIIGIHIFTNRAKTIKGVGLFQVFWYWYGKAQKLLNARELNGRSAVYQNKSLIILTVCAKACNEFAGLIYASLRQQPHSFFRRNVGAMTNRCQQCVQFDRPEIWTSDLPLQRRTRYRPTNWSVSAIYAGFNFSFFFSESDWK